MISVKFNYTEFSNIFIENSDVFSTFDMPVFDMLTAISNISIFQSTKFRF